MEKYDALTADGHSIIKKKLSARSDRVKSVDLHPTEPWVLSALYSGHLFLWNYNTEQLEKSFEVVDLPLRCAKFIPRKSWVVCGADDMFIRVYNYNTMEKVKAFEAHSTLVKCPPPLRSQLHATRARAAGMRPSSDPLSM